MNKTWIKIALPIAALTIGVGGMLGIKASAEKQEEKEAVDTRPTVRVKQIQADDYQIIINSFGEVRPLESTMLAAQVSGEVMSWHPDFVPGGLVKRGDILFSIEKDTYEAALLQAEADLSVAQASLIEEQARAEVAKREAKNLSASQITDLYLRKPQVLSAQAAVKSAQAKLRIAQRDLENCVVRAPYDALVISRNVGVGQFVSQGSTIAEINSIETAEVIMPIAGFDKAFLPVNLRGTQANLINKGLSDVSRQGTVVRDLGIVDQATRMTQLVVRIEDPYSLNSDAPPLKFGTYVEVDFPGKIVRDVFRLPQELVTNRTVWLVDGEQLLQPQSVTVLREDGEHFLIDQGLNNDDRVVMTLPEYPQKGMAVKINERSAANSLVAQQ